MSDERETITCSACGERAAVYEGGLLAHPRAVGSNRIILTGGDTALIFCPNPNCDNVTPWAAWTALHADNRRGQRGHTNRADYWPVYQLDPRDYHRLAEGSPCTAASLRCQPTSNCPVSAT
jgi:hypothetical protein